MRRKENLHQNENISQTSNDEKYMKIKAELKEEAKKNAEVVKRELKQHKKRIITDPTYSMNLMKEGKEKFIGQGYKLTD